MGGADKINRSNKLYVTQLLGLNGDVTLNLMRHFLKLSNTFITADSNNLPMALQINTPVLQLRYSQLIVT